MVFRVRVVFFNRSREGISGWGLRVCMTWSGVDCRLPASATVGEWSNHTRINLCCDLQSAEGRVCVFLISIVAIEEGRR